MSSKFLRKTFSSSISSILGKVLSISLRVSCEEAMGGITEDEGFESVAEFDVEVEVEVGVEVGVKVVALRNREEDEDDDDDDEVVAVLDDGVNDITLELG